MALFRSVVAVVVGAPRPLKSLADLLGSAGLQENGGDVGARSS